MEGSFFFNSGEDRLHERLPPPPPSSRSIPTPHSLHQTRILPLPSNTRLALASALLPYLRTCFASSLPPLSPLPHLPPASLVCPSPWPSLVPCSLLPSLLLYDHVVSRGKRNRGPVRAIRSSISMPWTRPIPLFFLARTSESRGRPTLQPLHHASPLGPMRREVREQRPDCGIPIAGVYQLVSSPSSVAPTVPPLYSRLHSCRHFRPPSHISVATF